MCSACGPPTDYAKRAHSRRPQHPLALEIADATLLSYVADRPADRGLLLHGVTPVAWPPPASTPWATMRSTSSSGIMAWTRDATVRVAAALRRRYRRPRLPDGDHGQRSHHHLRSAGRSTSPRPRTRKRSSGPRPPPMPSDTERRRPPSPPRPSSTTSTTATLPTTTSFSACARPPTTLKGHVPGAYNIPYKEIAKIANLEKLPTDKTIVVYCYTGHTAAASPPPPCA